MFGTDFYHIHICIYCRKELQSAASRQTYKIRQEGQKTYSVCSGAITL